MEPLPDEAPLPEGRRLSRRKLAAAGAGVAAIAAVVAAVLFIRGRGGPDAGEVARELKAAIAELSPPQGATGAAARFDTGALRDRLENSLDGWNIDLAADAGATKVGAAARQRDGGTCVFAWSDVGAPSSAVVSDTALPCVAVISLIPAKAPA